MLSKEQEQDYNLFLKSVQNHSALDAETTVLVQLAASIALGCYP